MLLRSSIQRLRCSTIAVRHNTDFKDLIFGDSLSKRAILNSLKMKDYKPEAIASEYKNFELVLHRTGNIITGISDGIMSRVLHVYCGTGLTKHLKSGRAIMVEGISDNQSDIEISKADERYTEVKYSKLDGRSLASIKSLQFDFLACLIPPNRIESSFNLADIIRLVNYHGVVIFGIRTELWDSLGFNEEFEDLKESMTVQFKTLQDIACQDEKLGDYSYRLVSFRREHPMEAEKKKRSVTRN